jgi:hypothetical protein
MMGSGAGNRAADVRKTAEELRAALLARENEDARQKLLSHALSRDS